LGLVTKSLVNRRSFLCFWAKPAKIYAEFTAGGLSVDPPQKRKINKTAAEGRYIPAFLAGEA
jgi:hypothetical protein